MIHGLLMEYQVFWVTLPLIPVFARHFRTQYYSKNWMQQRLRAIAVTPIPPGIAQIKWRSATGSYRATSGSQAPSAHCLLLSAYCSAVSHKDLDIDITPARPRLRRC